MRVIEYNNKYREKVLNMNWEDDFVKKDVLGCLEVWPDCGIIIEENEKVLAVGVFTGISKETSFTLYVDPENRGMGIGKNILENLEKKMIGVGVVSAICDFKVEDKIEIFICNKGYEKCFDSNYMVYEGDKLPLENYEIIQYEDKYYEINSNIYSEAFYNMRVLVGIEEKTSKLNEEKTELTEEEKLEKEKQRKETYNNKENIFLFKKEGQILGSITLTGNEIDAVAVDVMHQRNGYGKELVSFGVNKILERNNENVTLWAVEGNPAKYLYEKLGFKTLRVHEFVKRNLVLH